MEISRSGLIVVDMQNGFFNGYSQPVLEPVVSLVARWREAGGAVVFTRYHNYPGSPFERLINWSQLQTSPQIDLNEALSNEADEALAIIDKKIYSLFTPEGAALVDGQGWTDLVFCGIATESCVLKSAVDAFERDLTPWIVTDACSSHGGQEAHEAGLLVARRFIGAGQLVTSEELFNLLGSPLVQQS